MKGQKNDDGKYVRFAEGRNVIQQQINELSEVIQSLEKERKMLEDGIQITKGIIKTIIGDLERARKTRGNIDMSERNWKTS